MDNGMSLYLYIAKVYNPTQLKQLFGKEKISKTDNFTEHNIREDTEFGAQVMGLVRVCR